jgi:hypothetical protein
LRTRKIRKASHTAMPSATDPSDDSRSSANPRRHCERSEAIQGQHKKTGLLRRKSSSQ